MAELAVILVSTNEAAWLRHCLPTVFAHAGEVDLDVVVADNGPTDETREVVAECAPARVVTCANHGFAHANNRALETTDAPFVLFLNADTEIVEGTLGHLVSHLRENPKLALLGVKQVTPDGELFPTIRRFPTVTRSLFEALGSERLPFRASRLGERELDMTVYERPTPCDWTSGSFMLTRRAALDQAGWLDERFFLYSEEVDLCLRLKAAGWEIRHDPSMTILHHANRAGASPRMLSQAVHARKQLAEKHFGPIRRRAMVAALTARYGIRSIAPGRKPDASHRRAASRAAVRTLVGLDPPPFAALTLARACDPLVVSSSHQ
jgi:GT2 family glycosyltransferase